MSHLAAEASLRYAVHGTGGSFIKHGLDAQEGQSKAGLRPGDADWGLDPSPGVLTKPPRSSPISKRSPCGCAGS